MLNLIRSVQELRQEGKLHRALIVRLAMFGRFVGVLREITRAHIER